MRRFGTTNGLPTASFGMDWVCLFRHFTNFGKSLLSYDGVCEPFGLICLFELAIFWPYLFFRSLLFLLDVWNIASVAALAEAGCRGAVNLRVYVLGAAGRTSAV